MEQVTVKSIVSFILRHRRGTKAFNDWTVSQIEFAVYEAIDRQCICVDVTPDGSSVRGVTLGKSYVTEKRIHITGILVVGSGGLHRMFAWYKRHYNGWLLSAYRRGKYVVYNVEKLTTKIK